jgi:hypothetical protein
MLIFLDAKYALWIQLTLLYFPVVIFQYVLIVVNDS